jgi:hypothetical protein
LLAGGQLDLHGPEQSDPGDTVAEVMAALGIYCEEPVVIDDDEFWLWPENETTFSLWLTIQTQWLIGPTGPTGLNYPGIETCMRMHGFNKKVQQQLFGSIQVMEQAALEEWASKR